MYIVCELQFSYFKLSCDESLRRIPIHFISHQSSSTNTSILFQVQCIVIYHLILEYDFDWYWSNTVLYSPNTLPHNKHMKENKVCQQCRWLYFSMFEVVISYSWLFGIFLVTRAHIYENDMLFNAVVSTTADNNSLIIDSLHHQSMTHYLSETWGKTPNDHIVKLSWRKRLVLLLVFQLNYWQCLQIVAITQM